MLADDGFTNKDIGSWCSATPHPETCSLFMSRFNPKSREEFRTLAIQAALERALDAQTNARRIGCDGNNNRTVAVYNDCNCLIDNTVLQLNATLENIQSNVTFTGSDAQTWLSTALTNIEICRSGSEELNVTEFSSPILSGNVSELISNCLATNSGLMDNSSTAAGDSDYHAESHGFPNWVTSGERKLLQVQDMALAARPNVVVALDGSGQFRSIQQAINYAVTRRVGNARVVVYVKRGVYRENILISRTMTKVMLIGDGMRNTVITGSRSVAAGYTTYSSATVGKFSTVGFKFFVHCMHFTFKELLGKFV